MAICFTYFQIFPLRFFAITIAIKNNNSTLPNTTKTTIMTVEESASVDDVESCGDVASAAKF